MYFCINQYAHVAEVTNRVISWGANVCYFGGQVGSHKIFYPKFMIAVIVHVHVHTRTTPHPR